MKTQKGFSLIEVIGVMAIIAILLSAAAPNVIKLIKNERQDAEDVTLESIGEAFVAFVEEKQIIPNGVAWEDSLSNFVDLSTNDLSQAINGNRVLYIHPDFTIGNFPTSSYNQDSIFQSTGDVPLDSTPGDPRVIIASNLYTNITTTTLTSAQFDAVWNQTGSIPTDLVEADSVSIERINLNAQFFPVIFNVASAPGSWAVNTTASADDAAWPASVQERYLLKNSKVYTREVDGVDPITDIYLVNQATTIGSNTTYAASATTSSGSGGTSSSATTSSSSSIDCSAATNWNNGTTFNSNDQVKHSNKLYTSNHDSNRGNPPASSTWWWTLEGDCP